ncbi:MAG TPA: carboxypeptidase-like regulatory domain-containing protein [Bryobacteraceae bacterium]|nr:carboxypeptidase-like regulatory domain-containing protein [Bryobacteraceae bacterium]
MSALIGAQSARGQSTFATVTGVVTDPAGAAVPGATVEAIHSQTNFRYTATANDEGQYTVANILDGRYTLEVKASGFQEYKVESLVLTVREVRRVDVQLQLGQVGQTVEVTGGVSLIETETARIADYKDRVVLRNLPLTLRRAWDYFTLSPQLSFQRSGFQMRFAGSRDNQAEVTMDGTSIARSGGGFASGPLLDRTEAFQEMRIDIAGNGAEFAVMGQVSMSSRSGTNDFHGTFSDYYSTPAFNARNPFALTRTGSVSHRLTVSAGGPVVIPKLYNGKNRTFVFGTIEAGFGSGGRVTLNQSAPIPAWRRGDFSGVAGLVLRDPFNGNAPFAGNVIPAARINRVSQTMQERFYSIPNFGDQNTFAASNYREVRQNTVSHQPTYTLRADHRFSSKAFVYGRLTRVDWNLDNFEPSLPLVQERRYQRRNLRAATIAYTHTIRPTLLNEARWGTSFDELPIYSNFSGKALAEELGLRGLAPNLPDVGGIPRINFDGLGLTALTVSSTCIPCSRDLIHTWTDNVTWIRGGHTRKMGASVFRGQFNEIRQPDALFGDLRFSNRYTGHPYGDFLLGVPSTLSRGFPAIEPKRYNWQYGFYFSDEWKATPRVTVTWGVRYQIYTGWKESNGRQALFDRATGSIVIPDAGLDKVSPLMPTGYVPVITASKAGYSADTLTRPDKNNFAPRLSVAWRPFNNNNTVIRAGAGYYFDTAPQGPSAGQTVPFFISEPPFTNPQDNPLVLPQVFPATGAGGPSTVNLPLGLRTDLRVPHSLNYTLTFQRQQGNTGFRLTYAGTNTRQGVWQRNINQPLADTRLYVDKGRLFPQYPDITFRDNGAGHQYHGATVTVERRLQSGIHLQSYYTLARDIGDLENNQTSEDAYDRRRERAAWIDLPTHRFSTNVVYELPVGKGKKFASSMGRISEAILGHWIVSGIYTLESGGFITPLWTGPDPTGTRFTTGRTPPTVTIRPDQLRDPNLGNPAVNRWFDASAFAAPQPGRFGTSAKGVIKSTPTNVMHATLAKEFAVKERARIRLEFLANNVFNHPNYMDPNTNISSTGLTAVITAVQDRNSKMDTAIPRVLQAQLRVEW